MGSSFTRDVVSDTVRSGRTSLVGSDNVISGWTSMVGCDNVISGWTSAALFTAESLVTFATGQMVEKLNNPQYHRTAT